MPVSERPMAAVRKGPGPDRGFALLGELPAPHRLALSYAPRAARLPTLALLALDARLAGIVRAASEPMLAQLRLAWWRDVLAGDSRSWPRGEPLLAALQSWQGRHGELAPLVDGWEQMTAPPPLVADALLALVDARVRGFTALAGLLAPGDKPDMVASTARRWALADLADGVSDPAEREVLCGLLAAAAPAVRLSRAMRPLVVLEGLASRRNGGMLALLATVRLGLLGR